MGLFSRKNDKKNKEDMSIYGPLELVVESCESKAKGQIVVTCNVKTGRVAVGETLIYKARFGDDVIASVDKIEAMMMSMQQAMEGTVAKFTLLGEFDLVDPTVEDVIVREE